MAKTTYLKKAEPPANEVMVDKTWIFKKGKDGKLKIIVHKSAIAYSSQAN